MLVIGTLALALHCSQALLAPAARSRSRPGRWALRAMPPAPSAAAVACPTSAAALRAQIAEAERTGTVIRMPCVYDGLTARLVERAGFPLTFMTGA